MKTPAASSTPDAMPRHISLVAVPDAVISTLAGLYDVLNGVAMMGLSGSSPFAVEVVGESAGPLALASGMPFEVQRAIGEIETTDIVIVPSFLLRDGHWRKGRYPLLVTWLRTMHDRGAVLCSACSGIFLIAETDLFDGHEATVHFLYAQTFASAYPAVPVHPERVLVISGQREDLVSSGASNTWHDLALYLTARYAGVTVAQALARAFALQWHHDGLSPYMLFEGRFDHGDSAIESAQRWLSRHFAMARPVEAVIEHSSLSARTFKRRFTRATGLAPIVYVQRLRVEDAKRRLERTDTSVEEISWRVGYEDAAFFRRLFKRVTGMTPASYRKRFRVPDFVRPGSISRQ